MIMINHGSEKFAVRRGDRIAQIVFAPCVQAEIDETDELGDTSRSSGGFGSTGMT
jgi:dUTP pyrophosphatase